MFTSKDAREWQADRMKDDLVISDYVVRHNWKKKSLFVKIFYWTFFILMLGIIAISLG